MNARNCSICELRCRLMEGRTGACGRYELSGNAIVERFADHYLAACPLSIETMPILHYYPGGKFLQITTTGCNFNCPGCISTVLVREMFPHSSALKLLTPEQIIAKAVRNRCKGIVFLMNDPLASFPTFLKIAQLARDKGLKTGCSSNTYFTPEALAQLHPYLNFINIGLKGFSDKVYQACGVPSIRPVLRNLEFLYHVGVHIEISCILTRDNMPEIMDLAQYIARLSPDIPLQVMRFLPFENTDIALEPTIDEAENMCRRLRRVLNFVYLFNTPGSDFLHTRCPRCGHMILQRDFYGPMGAKLRLLSGESGQDPTNQCPACGDHIPILGPVASNAYQEQDFQGGYPLTRALEIVEAVLIAIGVTRKAMVVRAWEDILKEGRLKKLHHDIQQPHRYIEMIRSFGHQYGQESEASERAEHLARYIEARLADVEKALTGVVDRPRVYYAMGKPLFYINGERMENQLVELAGGISLNKQLPPGGRPGRSLDVNWFRELNPDIIFISAFLSSPVDDFMHECCRLGAAVNAVTRNQVHVHPAPGWDFGSPRWILGLMHLASIFHPERCPFDVMAEAQTFYRQFYDMDFSPETINRSFAKPSGNWHWQEATAPSVPAY